MAYDYDPRHSVSPPRNRSRSPRGRRYSRSRSRSLTPPSRYRFRSRSGSPRRFSRRPPPSYSGYRRGPPPRGYRDYPPPPPRRSENRMLRHLKENSQQDRRVYVGNLAYDVKWHQLKDFMKQAGEVIFADVVTSPTGRSKGFGVVEYSTREEAENAIATLTNQELMGRAVFVREDRETTAVSSPPRAAPPPPSSQSPSSSRQPVAAYSGPAPPPHHDSVAAHQMAKMPAPKEAGAQLFVSNIPYSVSWREFSDFFKDAGNIVRVEIFQTYYHRSKGTGVVQFETAEEAQRAIEMFNGYEWMGRPLEVRVDRFAVPKGSPRYGSGSGGGDLSPKPAAVNSEFTENATGNGEPSDTIYVDNLPYSTTSQDLIDLFETTGKVDRAEIQYRPDGRTKGSGVVKFDTPASAEISISKLNGYSYGNRKLALSYVNYYNRSEDVAMD